MNLELVPCMFKSRQNDGHESQFVGLIVRTPDGKAMAAIPPNTNTTTSCQTRPTAAKTQLKLQPKPNGIVPITPKLLPSHLQTMIPAMVSTSASSTNVTVTSSSGHIGVGSVFELPMSAVSQGGTVNLTIAKPPTAAKKTKTKAVKKKDPKADSDSSCSASRSSLEMQSPPQIVSEAQFVATSSSFLPPIASIAPPPSYQLAAGGPSTNGCTAEDLNAINLAHDLHNEHEMNRAYWQGQPGSSGGQFYSGQDAYSYPSSSNAGFNPPPAEPGYPSNTDFAHHPQQHQGQNGAAQYGGYHQNGANQGVLGHHNGASHQWGGQPPQRQLHYPGQNNNNNQMTSSTPDSGIQSIDGSPPSSSAFTPPMVSPYPVQSSSYDHGLQQPVGLPSLNPPLPGSSLHPGSNQIQPSHVQLPPLNFKSSHSSHHNQQQMQQRQFCPLPPPTYLDSQQPSCSYSANHMDAELDDIRIEPVSPPALDSEKRADGDNDSDVDYSEMPTLFRADDHSKAVVQKAPSPEPERTESRLDTRSNAEIFGITANMNADEIATKLLSTLTADKILEVLKHIPSNTTVLQVNVVDAEVAPPKTTVKQAKNGRKEKKLKPSPPPSTPPPTVERPLTRNSLRSPSLVSPPLPLKATTTSRKPKTKDDKPVETKKAPERAPPKVKRDREPKKAKEVLKEQKQQPKKNARVKAPAAPVSRPAARKLPKPVKRVARTRKTKDRTSVVLLQRHPYANFHHPRRPRNLPSVETSHSHVSLNDASRQRRRPSKLQPPKMLSMCDSMDHVIAALTAIQRPSRMLKDRYETVANNLAHLLEKADLKGPKTDKVKWEPSGSWTSCFNASPFKSLGKRKPAASTKAPAVPAKKAKTDKTGPLKISIASTPPTPSKAVKKKGPVTSAVTPVSRDDYQKIRSNVLTEAPFLFSLTSKPCGCTQKDPCTSTSECLTRCAFKECTQLSCPDLYLTCQNRRLENNDSVHQLQKFDKPSMGRGVRATVDIGKGQLVTEYVGEVLRKDTYLRRLEAGQSHPHYAVELVSGSYVIDASRKGNLSRLMNHSCKPNCVMQRWMVKGEHRVGIYALQDIEAGVELTYDYAMHVHVPGGEPVKCLCEAVDCKLLVPSMPPPSRAPRKPNKLTKSEIQVIRSGHVFLKRNVLRYKPERTVQAPRPGEYLTELAECLQRILVDFVGCCSKERVPRRWLTFIAKLASNTFESLTEKSTANAFLDAFDAAIKHSLSVISKSMEAKRADALQQQYLSLKRQSKVLDVMREDALSASVLGFLAERRKPSTKKADHSPKIISATADLTYMDSDTAVGSYNPDEDTLLSAQAADGDSVRCVCGIMDEGGIMVECDACHYWLHGDCLGIKKALDGEFICLYCKQGLASTPLLDIPLIPQPDFAFDRCTYYRTLVNCRGIQARVNECVYMEKVINDEYKKLLKRFNEEYVDGKPVAKKKKKTKSAEPPPEAMQAPPEDIFRDDVQRIYHRKDLRVFRIVRLFKVPTGERFAFGCYYARPHETFVDSGRMFFRNELCVTPLFDTLPVDAIVGRCLVLEPADFALGRPKGPRYHEEDVYVCEYAIDRNQKQFEKLTEKNRYQVNTADYLFDRFDKPLSMKRTFTPFVIKDRIGRNTNDKNPKIRLSTVVRDTSATCLSTVVDGLVKAKQSKDQQ